MKVSKDGSVTGTFPYVESFPQFSSAEDEQSGHYFPFTLTKSGAAMVIKKNGTESYNGKWEKDNIFRVTETTDTFEISVDGEVAVTLNFKGATLQPNAIRSVRSRKAVL